MNPSASMWGGRFDTALDPTFARFNSSFAVDRRLLAADIRGSKAHCTALQQAGVLTRDEADAIRGGLDVVVAQATSERLADSQAEDVHTYIEDALWDVIGDVARKLPTGRSRNDQVSTALRLWLRDELDALHDLVRVLQGALITHAEQHPTAVLPGYTHLQRAQPVMWAHWCLAYHEMLARDAQRLLEVRRRVDVMPLGSGALAGTSVAIDREALAVSLGFSAVSTNSLDAVSDRDFCVEFTSAASLAMMHLSRLSEDLILYSTHEFGFVHLSDAIATGSSLMPQKKNPDALELLRGKSGRVFGHLMGTLSILKGLPLAYNKDMQEDKAAVFDTADTLRECLQVAATVLANIRVDEPRAREAASQGCMNATELADYLASQGIPFRQAHELVGKLVVLACSKGQELSSLSLGEMRAVCPLIDDEVYEVLTLHRTLASKRRTGGTAPERVSTALAKARAHHEAWRQQA